MLWRRFVLEQGPEEVTMSEEKDERVSFAGAESRSDGISAE